jgi:prepilin-type N-terminal cleavage/methylation domain-containing protein
MDKKKNKGFTLMEMLIVVAVIAILVAIAIPTFTKQIHKAKVMADWANLRSFYATLQTDYMLREEYIPEYKDTNGFPTQELHFYNDGVISSTVYLKAGYALITGTKTGYQVYYQCAQAHDECELLLGPVNG